VVFRDPAGITLNDASVRDLTGSNDDDRDIGLTLTNSLDTTAVAGGLVVSGIRANDFPSEAAALRTGFDRSVTRFWETNYERDQYRFANRGDLEVDVTFQVTSPLAPNGGGAASTATIVPEQRNLNVQWWGGGANSLRRLRGQVRLRFEDLELLTQAGEHSADISVCVEVSGNL
jgi:hypothetical protein